MSFYDLTCISSTWFPAVMISSSTLKSIKKSQSQLPQPLRCFPSEINSWVHRVTNWAYWDPTGKQVFWRLFLFISSFLPEFDWTGWKFKICYEDIKDAKIDIVSSKLKDNWNLASMFHPNGLQKVNIFQRRFKIETKIKTGVLKCWFNQCGNTISKLPDAFFIFLLYL